MSTILELVARGDLVKLDPALGESELEQRCIYLHSKVAEYLNNRLEAMESELNLELSPAEQLDELVHHFVTGGELDHPRQFHVMRHRHDGIWELKTSDLRMFGWFADFDCFVCTDVANATDVKHGPVGAQNFQGSLYAGFCEAANARRAMLDLDEPKFLVGKEPENVVSNCHRS